MKKLFKKGGNIGGFTLVELLIVIGILGAIALIVIAAINPIEQLNRARDTRFRSDSGQLVSAVDRYFATVSQFPWVTEGGAQTYTNDDSFGFIGAHSIAVGVCGTDCTTDGTLISTEELKSEFRQRDFIQKGSQAGAELTDQIWIGKQAGSTAGVYGCYIPISNSAREKAVLEGKVKTIDLAAGTISSTSACDNKATAVWVGAAPGSSCMVCIPE